MGLVWRITRYPTNKRLAPMLGVLVPALRRDGELEMTDAAGASLVAMSPATIDRRLPLARKLLMPRSRISRARCSSTRSYPHLVGMGRRAAGFVEIDLVGREGGNLFGEGSAHEQCCSSEGTRRRSATVGTRPTSSKASGD